MPGQKTAITDFIAGICSTDIPNDALHMARRCIVDTVGIWASGIDTDPSQIARNHAVHRYPGTLPLPFDGRPVNPVGYAFAGAASIDAIDGHDGHQNCKGHASVALLPVLLAEQGNLADRSLDALLADFVVGTEIALRAGLALHATAPDYHSSGAWNALGCAAISARCRTLSAEATWHALGIAEYYGPRAQMMRCIEHPTMVKDSSAWGALTGVSAADLAEDGFTGAPALTCDSMQVDDVWNDLGTNWRILETNFKAYPVCRWSHPVIEAIRTLKKQHALRSEHVTAIEISTFSEATRLNTRRPADGDAAQYALPLAAALALIEDDLTPDAFLPASFDRPDVWRLVDQVTCRENKAYNAVFPTQRFCDVTLVTQSNRRFTEIKATGRGNFDAPLSDAELLSKFDAYASARMTAENRQQASYILSDPPQAATARGLLRMLEL